MSAKYIMAIDEGTTSTRTIIFNHAGQKLPTPKGVSTILSATGVGRTRRY